MRSYLSLICKRNRPTLRLQRRYDLGRSGSSFYSSIYYNSNQFMFSSNSAQKKNASQDDDDGASGKPSIISKNKHIMIDATTRSLGQVIFLNSTNSSRAILASLAIGDPTLAIYAALGACTATFTAQSIIGLNQQSCSDGLLGYNGALIGCAMSVFGPSFAPLGVAYTIVGASATSVFCASLNKALSQPQWTWSFNAVALTSLLRMKPLEMAESMVPDVVAINAVSLCNAVFVAISQIFVVNNALTGVGIVGSIGMYSPKLACHALGGSSLGCLVGILLGADPSDVINGLWGYNSALASMAVGTFFVHSRESVYLSAGSAAASAALFGALQPVFQMHGVPCLTLPFCAVTSACYLLEGQVAGLKLAKEPHSPERNA